MESCDAVGPSLVDVSIPMRHQIRIDKCLPRQDREVHSLLEEKEDHLRVVLQRCKVNQGVPSRIPGVGINMPPSEQFSQLLSVVGEHSSHCLR